jgi:colicin import membrane protein
MTMTIDAEVSNKPELIEWRKQDAAIAQLAEQYMPLRIEGLTDKVGFKKVHEARMVVKNTRVAVEKKRKELKADALAYGQAVDAEARRLTKLLEPIETHLQAEEDAVEAEKERLRKIEEDAKRAALQKRLDALAAYGVTPNPLAIVDLTEERFQEQLEAAKVAAAERERLAEIERKRLADEAEARRIEGEKLAAERAELDRQRREQDAERQKIEAERRAVELEKAKQEAAEKARIDTERRLAEQSAREKAAAAAEAQRLADKAKADEAARLKAEAERPQREKIEAVAELIEQITPPAGPGYYDVCNVLQKAAADIREIASGELSGDSK